ncbi:MAG: hypothetical protein ACRDD4_12410 [Culicoidibacterales bacterium]
MNNNLHWPQQGMDFWKINNRDFQVEIKWSKNTFEDYKDLAYDFYNSGYQVFKEVVESSHDNIKSDMWFLPAIFLVRHSLELGLKALIARNCQNNQKIQANFKKYGHKLPLLWQEYVKKGTNLSESEKEWLTTYFQNLDLIDKKSDVFRFPFEDDFLKQYQNSFISNIDTANNMIRAFKLVEKCLECKDDEINIESNPEFFVMANHGNGNCYFWQGSSDNGFYVKVTGYMEVANFIFENNGSSNNQKLYPLLFILRNAIELCLKHIFYVSFLYTVDSSEKYLAKRRSHEIKKDLWQCVAPIIRKVTTEQEVDLSLIDIVEEALYQVDLIDRKGDVFRYPTNYSLQYTINDRFIDVENVYTYMIAIVHFLDSFNIMHQSILEYEHEMITDYYW